MDENLDFHMVWRGELGNLSQGKFPGKNDPSYALLFPEEKRLLIERSGLRAEMEGRAGRYPPAEPDDTGIADDECVGERFGGDKFTKKFFHGAKLTAVGHDVEGVVTFSSSAVDAFEQFRQIIGCKIRCMRPQVEGADTGIYRIGAVIERRIDGGEIPRRCKQFRRIHRTTGEEFGGEEAGGSDG